MVFKSKGQLSTVKLHNFEPFAFLVASLFFQFSLTKNSFVLFINHFFFKLKLIYKNL